MKHIKNFKNVLNMLRIASRTFIVNNPLTEIKPLAFCTPAELHDTFY